MMEKKMRLNKREKDLLILLGIIITFCFFQRKIFPHQTQEILKLEEQKLKYEKEIINMLNILDEKEKIKANSIRMNREKDRAGLQYFSNLEQSQIIYLLDSVLNECKLKILDINFSQPEIEELSNNISIRAMNLSISYRGSYEELLECLNKIKNSPKKFLITNLIIDREDKYILMGEIQLKVYSIENIFDEKDNISVMNATLNSDRKSPFESLQEFDDNKDENIEDGLDNIINKEVHTDEDTITFDNDKTNNTDRNEIIQRRDLPEGRNEVSDDKSKKDNGKNKEKPKEKEKPSKTKEESKEKNNLYLDFSNKDIKVDSPKSDVGFWLYSHNISTIKLKLSFIDQEKKKAYIEKSCVVSENGWNYLEVEVLESTFSYPLKLDKMYFECESNDKNFRFIFIDDINIQMKD